MSWLEPSFAAEGERIMTICNACRYCEGYCAVFPAMEKRTEFGPADLGYLANLCHNCGACLPACQYAPPHEFGVNVPQTLSQIRIASYQLPRRKTVLMLGIASAGLLLLVLLANTAWTTLFARHAGGAFYDVISHDEMVRLFLFAGAWALIGMGLVFATRYGAIRGVARADYGAIRRGWSDALRLVNLGGGGEGCIEEHERPAQVRRIYHHLVFYGFLSCFLATIIAAFYDNVLGWRAPYPFASLPVIFGTLGGIALLVGCAGLFSLLRERDAALSDKGERARSMMLLAFLFATAATGLLLLVFRGTAAMGILLILHLAIVFGLFVTLPYGKFMHGFFRLAALVRFATEQGD
ncbi:MAG TPA: tricarballylate utilization 4Fe-4S protein TcuB [Candidatus Baltobacteraceae bacterium]|nr:tricarballylate utilization 4Fe-4S protein TcuB [Candidatus Baltobacteraceae bacterium]